jgi:hypothetical protein
MHQYKCLSLTICGWQGSNLQCQPLNTIVGRTSDIPVRLLNPVKQCLFKFTVDRSPFVLKMLSLTHIKIH